MPGGTRQNIGFIGFFRHIGGYDPDICSGLPAILTARLFWITPEAIPSARNEDLDFIERCKAFIDCALLRADDKRLAN